jgi:large subunit ribosomal protein L21
MRYAVVEAGGKQWIAREGETLEVDRMPVEPGKTVELEEVLLVVDGSEVRVGTPRVEGAKVTTTVVDHTKGPKVLVFKYIPKERYRRRQGHRQQLTRLAIQRIEVPGMAVSQEAGPAETPKPAAKKTVTKKAAAKTGTTKAAAKKSVPKK